MVYTTDQATELVDCLCSCVVPPKRLLLSQQPGGWLPGKSALAASVMVISSVIVLAILLPLGRAVRFFLHFLFKMHEKRGNFCIFLLKIAEKEGKNGPVVSQKS